MSNILTVGQDAFENQDLVRDKLAFIGEVRKFEDVEANPQRDGEKLADKVRYEYAAEYFDQLYIFGDADAGKLEKLFEKEGKLVVKVDEKEGVPQEAKEPVTRKARKNAAEAPTAASDEPVDGKVAK